MEKIMIKNNETGDEMSIDELIEGLENFKDCEQESTREILVALSLTMAHAIKNFVN